MILTTQEARTMGDKVTRLKLRHGTKVVIRSSVAVMLEVESVKGREATAEVTAASGWGVWKESGHGTGAIYLTTRRMG